MRQTLFIAAAGALLAAGCAQIEEQNLQRQAEAQYAPADASADAPDCFYPAQIRSYGEVDRDTVRVRINLHDYYDVNVTPTCMDLTWANGMAIVAQQTQICVGDGANQGDVVARGQRCPIVTIAHSTPRPAGG